VAVAAIVLAAVIMNLTTAVADAIIIDDSGDEEEILHGDFRWETMDNYTGHREVFSCDSGARNGAENLSDIVQCFELFFDKKNHKTNCQRN